ncbi:MAG: bifunctional 5,10-methylenetetrahydrofolate dehydrogenase/5,10-methenyltetrahydrofolate cyclohydrolase [Luteibaculum sp.]
MKILDGKATAEKIRAEIKQDVAAWIKRGNRAPHLAAVLVGDNGASLTYVNAKIKDCKEVGFKSSLIKLPSTITQNELLEEIEKLNNDDALDGFIVQLPLPKHIDEGKITQAILPTKDVDGFHPENLGKMVLNLPTFLPATPYGIIQLLEYYSIDTSGKNCLVIGRSNIVGTPISILMSRNNEPGNATVTLAHSRTQDLERLVKEADILIVALGKPDFIKGDMIKPGAVIIDVGITRVADATKKKGYRVAGDVDFESVSKKASFITPVPGGVGPMTRVSLLKNTLLSCKRSAK